MSDSIKGLIVTFKKPYHEDYAKKVREAILLFDGVTSVKESVNDFEDTMRREQVKRELLDKIWEILK
jgi:hypothetical protein